MKFKGWGGGGGRVVDGERNKIKFGGEPDHHTDCPVRNLVITQHSEQILMKFSRLFCNDIRNNLLIQFLG